MPASVTPTRTDFIPVVLGGDIGSYALIREFHEAYHIKSIAFRGFHRRDHPLETR